MRVLIRSLVIASVTSFAAMAQQPAASVSSSERATEIMRQVRLAIGDESKLDALKSLSLAGPSRRVLGERETQTEVEVEMLFPDKLRRLTTVAPFPGMDTQIVDVLNGAQVWSEVNSSVPPGGPGGGGQFQRMIGMAGPGAPGAMGGDEASRQLATKVEFTRLLLGLLAVPPASVQVEYKYIAEAKAPDGIADVIEATGPGETKTRLFVDRNTHRILMISYRAKDFAMIRGGAGQRGGQPGGQPGGGQARGQGQGQGQPPGQGQGQGQAGAQQPQMTPEEREQRRAAMQQQMQEAAAKAPEVDFFWRFGDYKPVNGLNLPHLITKATGDKLNEEWVISKLKVNPSIKTDKFDKKEKK